MTGTFKTAGALAALGAAVWAPAAAAQETTQGFAVERYSPATPGSPWSTVDSLDFRDHGRVSASVDMVYNQLPLAVYPGGGQPAIGVVQDQLLLHLTASVTLFERLRVSGSLPTAVYQRGATEGLESYSLVPPRGGALGDARLGADVWLLGEARGPLSAAAGLQAFLPTGRPSRYTGDGVLRLHPMVMAAGVAGPIEYGARLGFLLRTGAVQTGPMVLGNELTFGAGIANRVSKSFSVGGELSGSTRADAGAFRIGGTPTELLATMAWAFNPEWRLTLAGGPGLTKGVGSPQLRVMTGLEFQPQAVAERPVPDWDLDGIPDAEDACVGTEGVRTSSPSTNGCPATKKKAEES